MSSDSRDLTRLRGAPPARREIVVLAAFALGATTAMIWGWNWGVRTNDFGLEAASSFAALLHGHVLTFLHTAPAYGASLILRAPFALPAGLAHAGTLLVYQLSALPCLLAIATLGLWLARELRRVGGKLISAALVVAFCVANPITYRAMAMGHPEELLGAALCVAAVLAAQRGRAHWAALALGLAVANKQWALIAVGPVLLALPDRRLRTVVEAAAVALALYAPILMASGSLTAGTARVATTATGETFHPWQVFWFFGARGHWTPAMSGYILNGFRLPPTWIGGRPHLLIVGITAPLTWWSLHRRTRPVDALLLLALLALLRCWLDPWDIVYYPLPFIFALAAWETSTAHRAPLCAVVATAATWLIFWFLPAHLSADAQSLSFLVPSTLALAALAVVVYRLRPGALVAAAMLPLLTRAPATPS
ncbi:MAG TPA: hypothetical protein VFC22_01120 [Solirubrobacteraceae bacterium]|nr:hypothetical protein [Solirubrobacteraceae bacterium]